MRDTCEKIEVLYKLEMTDGYLQLEDYGGGGGGGVKRNAVSAKFV